MWFFTVNNKILVILPLCIPSVNGAWSAKLTPALGMLVPVGNEALEVQGSGLVTRALLGIHHHTHLSSLQRAGICLPKLLCFPLPPKLIGVIAFKSKHSICSFSPQYFQPFSSWRQVLKHNSSSSNQRLWKSQEKPQNIVKFYRSNKSEVIFFLICP